jgi:hypothetical protein
MQNALSNNSQLFGTSTGMYRFQDYYLMSIQLFKLRLQKQGYTQ